uniref:NADH-ubiquinone oxidoreductase chain 4L n=1 Tax=Gmelinoides fasciatus TaxID=686704 RepID=A0A1L5BW52_9CRUS|nr:NADH dehydrogenase subunit 4L [Gmelinoides fasciatus]APL97192.1 NADH dehydrogenase subunit 4L [Gmelinoides fasciatus]
MTSHLMIAVVFGLFAGLFSFVMNYSHFLSSLLSLEFLALMVYWWLGLVLTGSGGDLFLNLFYLCVSVCEGSLGLSLLVKSVHSHGSDRMKSYSFMSC